MFGRFGYQGYEALGHVKGTPPSGIVQIISVHILRMTVVDGTTQSTVLAFTIHFLNPQACFKLAEYVLSSLFCMITAAAL